MRSVVCGGSKVGREAQQEGCGFDSGQLKKELSAIVKQIFQ